MSPVSERKTCLGETSEGVYSASDLRANGPRLLTSPLFPNLLGRVPPASLELPAGGVKQF